MPSGFPSADDDLQEVGDEDRAAVRRGQPLVDHLLQVRLVGRREHVGRRPLDDRGGQVGRAVGGDLHVDAGVGVLEGGLDVLERALQRRRRQHGHACRRAPAPPRRWTWSSSPSPAGLVVVTARGDEQGNGQRGRRGHGASACARDSSQSLTTGGRGRMSPMPADRERPLAEWMVLGAPGRGARPTGSRWPASSRPVVRSVGCGPRAARSPTEPSTSWPPRADRARPHRARPRPQRTVHELTAAGREALAAWLRTPVPALPRRAGHAARQAAPARALGSLDEAPARRAAPRLRSAASPRCARRRSSTRSPAGDGPRRRPIAAFLDGRD